MGNSLGSLTTNNATTLTTILTPKLETFQPNHDPMLGFPNGRKQRVMMATQEEMESAKIPLEYRNYCTHHLIDYKGCRKDHFPFVWRCRHEKHLYQNCLFDDYIIRYKEYEREQRLKAREERIAKKQKKEMLE